MRKSGSRLTPRWSKADSNSGSHPRATPPAATRFVADSALEGDGFELPVLRENGYSVELSYFAYLIEMFEFCRRASFA